MQTAASLLALACAGVTLLVLSVHGEDVYMSESEYSERTGISTQLSLERKQLIEKCSDGTVTTYSIYCKSFPMLKRLMDTGYYDQQTAVVLLRDVERWIQEVAATQALPAWVEQERKPVQHVTVTENSVPIPDVPAWVFKMRE